MVFQRGKAGDLDATFHFSFTGAETRNVTIEIRGGRVTVEEGLIGQAVLHVTADVDTWLGFLAGEKNVLWAIVTRQIRVKGPISLLKRFGSCFLK